MTVTLATTTDSEAEVRAALNLPEPPPAPVDPPAAEPAPVPAADPTPKPEPVVRAKPDAQTRINELTREKYDALAERDALRQELETLRQAPPPAVEAKPAEVAAETAAADPEPNEDAYETFAEYTRALAKWSGRQEARTIFADEQQKQAKAQEAGTKAQREAQGKERQDTILREYTERRDVAKVKYADYDDLVAQSQNLPVNPPMRDVIIHSPHGTDIGVYLMRHPEEAARIAALPPGPSLVAMGRLEERAESGRLFPAETMPAPVVARPAPVSDAPPPPPRLAPGTVTPAKSPDEMSHAEFKAWRAAQGAR